MQTFLLTIASAVILAIAAAFAAPLFVDWTQWRAVFEAQAARTVGAPVTIRGPIEAELLPVPQLILKSVVIGADPAATALAAGEIRGTFALGPLMQGQFKAEQLTLVKPQLRLVIGTGGAIVLPRSAAHPSDFAITSLAIEDGLADVVDGTSGRSFALDGIDMRGEIGGPAGPFKFEGEARGNGMRRSVRLSLGAIGETAAGRLRLNVAPTGPQAAGGPSFDLDGVLSLVGGVPAFEGRANLTGRADPKAQMPVARAGWTVASTVRATREAVQFQELSLTLGASQRPIDLSGSGRLALAPAARLDLTLSARQIDLGAATAGAAPLTALAELIGAAAPAMEIAPAATIRLSSDTVLMGGAPLREVHTEFGWSEAGLSVSKLEAKLPGRTDLRLSGAVSSPAAGPATATAAPTFTGTVGFETEDPPSFAAWSAPAAAPWLDGLPPGAIRLAAKLDAAPGRVTLSGIDLAIGAARFTGTATYRPPGPSQTGRAEASLAAQKLDLDPLLPLLRRVPAMAGSPFELALAFSGRALRLSGLEAGQLDLALESGAGGVEIERLKVVNLGGLDLDGAGRLSPSEGSRFTARLSGPNADGLTALVRLFGPAGLDQPVARLAPSLAPIDLALSLDGHTGRTEIDAEGRLGSLAGKASASLNADWHLLDGQLGVDATDGAAVLGQLGLGGLRPGLGPARLDAGLAPGPADTPLLDGRLAFAGASLGARGEFHIDERGAARPVLDLALDKADLGRLFPTLGAASDGPIPARFTGRLSRPDAGWRLDGLEGSLSGVAVSGTLAYTGDGIEPIDAQLKVDRLAAERLLGLAVGRAGGTGPWPDGRFGPQPLPDFAARLSLAADQLDLPGGLILSQARLRARTGASGTSVEELTGALAGGRLTGSLKLRRRTDIVEANGHVALSGATLAPLFAAAHAAPGLSGRATLVLDLAGSGRSPAAVAQSLSGQGSLAVEDFELAGFDPRSLQYVMLATERGPPPDGRRTAQLLDLALARGPLVLPRIETPLSVVNGMVRTGTARSVLGALRVTASGGLDLARLTFDASIELEDGTDARAAAVPGATVSWRGPLDAPERRSDVAALGAAINLRTLERETRRLEAEYGRPAPPITDLGRAAPPTMDAGSPTATDRAPLPPAPPAGAADPASAPRPQTVRPRPVPPPATATRPAARPSEPDQPPPVPRVEPQPMPDATLRPPAEIPVPF